MLRLCDMNTNRVYPGGMPWSIERNLMGGILRFARIAAKPQPLLNEGEMI